MLTFLQGPGSESGSGPLNRIRIRSTIVRIRNTAYRGGLLRYTWTHRGGFLHGAWMNKGDSSAVHGHAGGILRYSKTVKKTRNFPC